MQFVRRDALRLLGVGTGSSVLLGGIGNAFAGLPVFPDDYCYGSDTLVSVGPDEAFAAISTADNFSKWTASLYRQIGPDLWLGRSYFTGQEGIYARFKVDPKRYTVDYILGPSPDSLQLGGSARAVPGKLLGYGDRASVIAVYAWHRAGTTPESKLEVRISHESSMYRIKAVAEHNAAVPANALPSGEYLATYSELVSVPMNALFDFISDGMTFGKWTWGRAPRTKVGADTFRCKSDFGGPDLFVRFDVDRDGKTVDYYVGEKPDAMMLHQSARVLAGPTFGFDAKAALVTCTRWRAAGQSNYAWDRAIGDQVEDLRMAKGLLEHGLRG